MSKLNPKTIEALQKLYRSRRYVESSRLRKLIDRRPNVVQYFNFKDKYAKEYKELQRIYGTATQGMTEAEKASSKSLVSLPGGKVQVASLTKFVNNKANFRQIKNIVNKLIPELREDYQYGHQNVSIIRSGIALALEEDKSVQFLSEQERKQLLALYTIADQIDKLADMPPPGYDKDFLINELSDIAAQGPDLSVSWKKDVDIVKGLKGSIEIEAEWTRLNQFKGNLSAWVGEMFSAVIREETALLDKYLSDVDISNLKGSPTLVEDVEAEILSVFNTLNAKKNFSTKGARATSRTSKNKAKTVKTTKKKKALPKIRAKKDPVRGVSSSPLQLITLINRQLPKVVQKNMVYPALQNRTGRFASSVRVTDVQMTGNGFPSFGYTYLRNPYETFEIGNAQGSVDIDPRKLIDKSIREIAAGYAIGRFYTRRV